MAYWLMRPFAPLQPDVGAAFGTFTTRQDVSPQPLPVARAGDLFEGCKILLKASGEYSSTGTPTLVLGFYFGTSAGAITLPLGESSANATSTATTLPWSLELLGTVVATGTAGSIVAQGYCDFGTSLTAHTSTPIPITTALRTVAIDTTIDRAFGVCGTWNASSASNTVRTNVFLAGLLT
jgi:hypothetical protein